MPTKKTKTSGKSGTPVGRSPLEGCLDRYFAAYARHFLTGERPLPSFRARLDGVVLELDVDAPDGTQRARRRPSAYLLLAGDLWGAARSKEERAAMPALVASITDHPDGGRNAWNNFFSFESDPDTIEGLIGLAEVLAATGEAGRNEGVLLLRSFLSIDDSYGPDRVLRVRGDLRPRRLSDALHADVAARSAVTPLEDWAKSTSPLSVAKKAAAFARSKVETERLAAATRIGSALHQVSYSNHLSIHAAVRGALDELLKDEDGAVFERALGAAQELAAKLTRRRAYAEAKPLLDLVVTRSVSLPEVLRQRWEVRLYLDDPAADEDWDRAALLDDSTDPSSVGPCMFFSGTVADRRNVVLSRVAQALVSAADGVDPCEDRKAPKKKTVPAAAERARLLARAAALSGNAMASVAPRAEEDLDAARAGGAMRERGFQADDFASRAKVREASGDLPGALQDFEKARELRVAAGISYQSDHFGEDIRRLRKTLTPPPANDVPVAFDPAWLLDAGRSTKEREAAVAKWAKEPWRTFPETPAAAVGRPFAYVILRDVVRDGSALWKIAAEDGIALGDRVAFSIRALVLLDAWCERRDASHLEDVLDDSHEVAFFGETTAVDTKPAHQRKALLLWVQSLTKAKRIEEKTVLDGLQGEPWARLGDCFEKKVAHFDPLRDLFDAVQRSGLGSDAVAAVLRVYRELLMNDWSRLSTPPAAWEKLAAPLEAMDASRLAPALAGWTRAQQRVPGYYGLPRLDAKWLWPLRYVWSEGVMTPLLSDVKKGVLDNGKSLSKTQRATRQACLGWLGSSR